MIQKNNRQSGFSHVMAIAGVVVVSGLVGTFMVVRSHASSCVQNTYSTGINGSECVRNIQKITNFRLNMNGYGSPLATDGNYGPKTKSAVMTLQRLMSLSVDGVWGPQTWREECTWYRQQVGNIKADRYGVNTAYMAGVYANAGC